VFLGIGQRVVGSLLSSRRPFTEYSALSSTFRHVLGVEATSIFPVCTAAVSAPYSGTVIVDQKQFAFARTW